MNHHLSSSSLPASPWLPPPPLPSMSSQPPLPSLSVQLITISVIILQRTIRHNRITTTDPISDRYDYIIVGCGTAGSVVGARLHQVNANTRILILEAGGPQLITSDMISHARQQIGSEIDWNYRTTSQVPYSGLAYDGHVALPRGRIAGGTHNMNFINYSRGNRRDFDSWSKLFGATNWSYDNVLRYFLRSENNTDLHLVGANPRYHSTTGRVVVRTPNTPDPIIEQIKRTLVDGYGVPPVDQNGPRQVGIGNFQQTLYFNATRATTASVFLEPLYDTDDSRRRNANLQVLTNALVRRVLFNTTNRSSSPMYEAIGVEFEYKNGTIRTVYANIEVILSAGSIATPQLLMLSGIGPRQHLRQFPSITPLVDLPVGYNLKDHVYVQLDFTVLDPSLVNSGIDWTLENLYRYFSQSSGPLAQFPLVYWYFNSQYNNDTEWPDIQIDFNVAPVSNDLDQLVAQYSVSQRDAWRQYYRDHVGERNRLGVLCFHFRPRSAGRLMLNSSDIHQHPLIDTRYLTDPYDISAMIDVIRKALQITHQAPFSRLIRLYRQPIPGCQLCTPGVPIWDCISYLECYARSVTMTVGHQVGTCKMGGNSGDNTVVVDTRLRVRGTRRLRVIDGSILPEITNGNTMAPCIMIGEHGAAMVLEDNGNGGGSGW